MARTTTPPLRDADLASFSQTFSAMISDSPTTYGLEAADATALATLVTSFINAYDLARSAATRTASKITLKNQAKTALLAAERALIARIRAFPGITDALLQDLDLPIHDRQPTPTPAPWTKPTIAVLGMDRGRILIRLGDETLTDTRAKPEGAVGAEIYSYVAPLGTILPTDLDEWRHEGLATRNRFEIDYKASDAGKVGTIVARWINRRGQTGPLSNPVSTPIATNAVAA